VGGEEGIGRRRGGEWREEEGRGRGTEGAQLLSFSPFYTIFSILYEVQYVK